MIPRKVRVVLGIMYMLAIAFVATACAMDLCGMREFVLAAIGFQHGGDAFVIAAIAPFTLDPAIMAVMQAYKNARMIADQVLHRIPVAKQKFGYLLYDKRETFTIQDNRVQRTGAPNKVAFSATRDTDEAEGFGLDDAVPQDDIENAAGSKFDPVMVAAEGIARLNSLSREKRVADLVFAAGSYASGNKTQLSGNDQWNVVHTDSNPIADIMTGIDACIMRPTHMAIGRAAFSALSRNAYILKAVNRNSGDAGIARRRDIADLFELEDIYVGEAWYNTAKRGQTASMARLWGKHCLLYYKDESIQTTEGGITFGFTAQWGDPIGGKDFSRDIGLKGGYVIRGGEYVKEKIMAADLGYFIEDAVA